MVNAFLCCILQLGSRNFNQKLSTVGVFETDMLMKGEQAGSQGYLVFSMVSGSRFPHKTVEIKRQLLLVEAMQSCRHSETAGPPKHPHHSEAKT